MTFIYSSFYCAICSSDTAGNKLDFKTSNYTFAKRMLKKKGTGATKVNLGKH